MQWEKLLRKKIGIHADEKKKHTSKRLRNGERRERELNTEMKELRQLIEIE